MVKKIKMIKLKQVYQELIQEGKQSGILYHFTSKDACNQITSNFTDSNPVLISSTSESFLSPGYKYTRFISMTRKYNLAFRKNISAFIQNVRFTFDGDKLSSSYKVVPINFHSVLFKALPDEAEERELEYKARDLKSGGEYEERIWMKEHDKYLPIVPYCLEVSILVSDLELIKNQSLLSDSEQYELDDLNFMIKYFDELGIPVVLTDVFKPYGRDKEIYLPKSL